MSEPPRRDLVPEFEVTQLHDDLWQAEALYNVTPWMADHGCRGIVRAERLPDLTLLCAAERIHADLTRAGERLHSGRQA